MCRTVVQDGHIMLNFTAKPSACKFGTITLAPLLHAIELSRGFRGGAA